MPHTWYTAVSAYHATQAPHTTQEAQLNQTSTQGSGLTGSIDSSVDIFGYYQFFKVQFSAVCLQDKQFLSYEDHYRIGARKEGLCEGNFAAPYPEATLFVIELLMRR